MQFDTLRYGVCMKKLLCLLLAGLPFYLASMALAFAQNGVLQQPGDALVYEAGGAARLTMNGYLLSDFGDFTKNWHYVTTTFRKDMEQMHFTYANDLAWKILSAGSSDYPDGAMFGKIAVSAIPHPAFANSYRPQQPSVYQMMVRDSSRFAETGGWGYMAYSPGGVAIIGTNDTTESESCHACHKLVKQQGYVFASPMSLTRDHGPSFIKGQDVMSPSGADK